MHGDTTPRTSYFRHGVHPSCGGRDTLRRNRIPNRATECKTKRTPHRYRNALHGTKEHFPQSATGSAARDSPVHRQYHINCTSREIPEFRMLRWHSPVYSAIIANWLRSCQSGCPETVVSQWVAPTILHWPTSKAPRWNYEGTPESGKPPWWYTRRCTGAPHTWPPDR